MLNNINLETSHIQMIPTTKTNNQVHDFNHHLKIIHNSHIRAHLKKIIMQDYKIRFHSTTMKFFEIKIPNSDKGKCNRFKIIEENSLKYQIR